MNSAIYTNRMNKTMRKDKPNMKMNVSRIISRSKTPVQPNISMGRMTGNKIKYEEHTIDKAANGKQSGNEIRRNSIYTDNRNTKIIANEKMDKKVKDNKRENHTQINESEEIEKNRTRIQRKIIQRFEVKTEELPTLVEQKYEVLENMRDRQWVRRRKFNFR